MNLMDSFGLAESAILMLTGILKFVYTNLSNQIKDLERRLEKTDDKFRQNEATLFEKSVETKEAIAYMKGKADG